MNLMGPPDPAMGESGIDSTGRRHPRCPCCGGWLDWHPHQCLPSAGGCQPGCSHEAIPAPPEVPVTREWDLPVREDAHCPRCYDGHTPALCPLAALATLLDLTGICERCHLGTVAPDQWVCAGCRDRSYSRYVGGVGLVRAATPELLEAAIAVVQAQARERDVQPPAPPRYPVILPVAPHRYVPPAARPLPGIERGHYARQARMIGQVQALIVVIIGGTASLFRPHDWAGAGRAIAVLLFLTQLLHWYVWSRRNDQ